MADGRKEPKSKYTARSGMPGAFEGETVTRRRLMTLTAHGAGAVAASAFPLPALGFAAGSALFERPPGDWEAVGPPEDFPDDTYIPRVITDVAGIGQVGKTTVYVRAQPEHRRPPNPPATTSSSSRSRRAACTSAARSATSRPRSASSARATAASTTSAATVDGGPPVRPLDRFYTRVRNGQVEVGPRYSVNGEFRRFPSYRDPGQDLDGIGQYLYPGRFSTPKMD